MKHPLPAFISFFIPGLGQLVKGHIFKGLFIWVGGIAIWVLSILIGFFVWWMFLVPVVFWIWNVSDAYNSN